MRCPTCLGPLPKDVPVMLCLLTTYLISSLTGVIKVDVLDTDDQKIQLVTKRSSDDAADVNHNLDQKDTDLTTDEDSEENDEVSSDNTMEMSENKAGTKILNKFTITQIHCLDLCIQKNVHIKV